MHILFQGVQAFLITFEGCGLFKRLRATVLKYVHKVTKFECGTI